MAKKKNTVKSAPKSLRQALSAVKSAIIHFSEDHVVAIGYNPTSKETIVSDIPQNLSSQFVLGEGGGGSSATPLVDIHVVNNSNNNIYLLYEGIVNNIYSFVVGTAISSTQSEDITAIATDSNDPNSVWSLNGPCTDSSGYEGQILPFTISDAENCSYDSASYGYPCIKITDPSQNASCTITYN